MRFTNILTGTIALIAASAGVSAAAIVEKNLFSSHTSTLSSSNNYGAPIRPWKSGCKPGWYYAYKGGEMESIASLSSFWYCFGMQFAPAALHCPKPSTYPPASKYQQTFSGLTGATQAEDYITYGLVDTVADCQVMCDSISGCTFFNTYHDNNAQNGKDASDKLTCSLFKKCHTQADATNVGGQPQPDGTTNSISDSEGYCKK